MSPKWKTKQINWMYDINDGEKKMEEEREGEAEKMGNDLISRQKLTLSIIIIIYLFVAFISAIDIRNSSEA